VVCENTPVNAPACPTCAYPLQWYATHNAWFCNRCQQMIPAQPAAYAPVPAHVQDHPSQPYSPVPAQVQDRPSQPYSPIPAHVQDHPSQPYSPFPPQNQVAAPPPPKKSRKGLAIGLAIAGVAVVGIIVAVVVKKSGPSRSRDAVIDKTVAALAAGDEDALFALADPKEAFTKTIRCEKRASETEETDPDLRRLRRKQLDNRDPDKLETRWRKDVGQLLRRTKGTKLEVVEILTEMPPAPGDKPTTKAKGDKDDADETPKRRDRDLDSDRHDDDEDRPEHDKRYKLTTYRKGQEVMKGCYATSSFRQQQVKVLIDIKEGEREFTQRVVFGLAEIDGSWYLSYPPNLNVGFDVIISDLQSWRDKTCKCTDAGCIEDLDDENGRLSFVQYDLDRDADLPKDMMTRIEKIQSERRVCEGTARAGPELVKYKELKTQLCACKDDECGKKIELEMSETRRRMESDARRMRVPSFEVTRQITDLALQAGECSRKLSLQRVRIYSGYPSSGDLAGGTTMYIRGYGFTQIPRTVKVFFGTKEATVARIMGDYEVMVEVPPGDAEGRVEVRAEFEPGGSLTLPSGFTYNAPVKSPRRP
jgi:hypothetical protein